MKTRKNSAKHRKRKETMLAQILKRLAKNKMAMTGLIILLIMIVACIFAPVVAPYSPTDFDLLNINAGPSLAHPAGTDGMGRDCFSRLIYGARYSLSLGLLSSLLGMVVGIVLGAVTGYFGGWIDNVIMRIMDIWAAIPGTLLAIVISTVLGGGFFNTVLALCISSVPMGVRIIRGQILTIRSSEFLEAAKSINCSTPRTMFLHLIPNVVSPLIVNTTMNVGSTIMQAAALSYLGLGVQPPTPEWGAMLSEGRAFITSYPHLIIFPGICIAIAVLCINLLGDGLRDAMDPKLKS